MTLAQQLDMPSEDAQPPKDPTLAVLEISIREQINEVDQKIWELHRHRDRLQFFLNDLKRCN